MFYQSIKASVILLYPCLFGDQCSESSEGPVPIDVSLELGEKEKDGEDDEGHHAEQQAPLPFYSDEPRVFLIGFQ